MRQSTVPALAFYVKVKGIRSRHDRAVAERGIARRNFTPDMHGNQAVAGKDFRFILHKPRAAIRNELLRGLE